MLNKYNNRSSELLQVIALWLELSLQQADASLLCFVSSPHKPAQQISTMSKAMSWPQILEVHVFPWSLPSLTASSIEKAGPQRWGKLKNQGRWWKSGSLVCREWGILVDIWVRCHWLSSSKGIRSSISIWKWKPGWRSTLVKCPHMEIIRSDLCKSHGFPLQMVTYVTIQRIFF